MSIPSLHIYVLTHLNVDSLCISEVTVGTSEAVLVTWGPGFEMIRPQNQYFQESLLRNWTFFSETTETVTF